METHFVHQDAGGELAVVGVLHAIGAENAALAPVLAGLEASVGEEIALPGMDPSAFLPADHAMYRYARSLTTPPCSEGVRWHVLQASTSASEEQVRAYRAVFSVSARPTQPLGDRELQAVAD